jgi:colanic acid/amylovoran biosynthesis protein
MTPIKIALVNAWSDDNKGDLGIYEGAIELLRTISPGASLNVLSHFQKSLGENHRHLSVFDPKIKVFPSLYSKKFLFPLAFLRDFFLERRMTSASWEMLASCDLVVGLGGQQFLNEKRFSLRAMTRLLFLLVPFIYAERNRIPFILLGHSVGPFRDFISKFLMRKYLKNADYLFARETLSFDVFTKELGFDEKRVGVIPDTAFMVTPTLTDRLSRLMLEKGLKSKGFWVVTVRKWRGGRRDSFFIEEMAKLIGLVLEKGLVDRIALVAHTVGPNALEDDRDITDAVFQKVKHLSVAKIEEDLTPGELAALYGSAEFLLGTRFHSVIFAVDGGTPAFAISYSGPKAWGIMKMLGCEDLCVDLEKFEAEIVFNRIKGLDMGQLRNRVSGMVSVFRKQLLEQISAAVLAVLSRPRGKNEAFASIDSKP